MVAIQPERECGERHYHDTLRLKSVMSFVYHKNPYRLYCALAPVIILIYIQLSNLM